MSKYIINGGKSLSGEVEIMSAKNSVLPILAACILTGDKVVINKCPDITDVDNMLKILAALGCVICHDGACVSIDSGSITSGEIPAYLAKELRSSIFLLGSILTRFKRAKVAYPGGCDIGMRPIDIHLKALRELNIDVVEEGGYIYCDSKAARAAEIMLDLPSVGATENVIMSAVCLRGRTVVRNSAREPEIVDLQNFLNKMGAKVSGAGGSVITIEGVDSLHGVEYAPIPDRIVAGTFLIAAAMTGGEVCLRGAEYEHIFALISKLSKTTCKIQRFNDKIMISAKGRHTAVATIETLYYPAFPTDLQAQMMALQTISKGTCVMVENIFESRYKHVAELKKMGAKITIKDRTAVISGVEHLDGAEVYAHDLRGGAGLVLAGLAAQGQTVVRDIHYIDRGYQYFDKELKKLGADIIRVD